MAIWAQFRVETEPTANIAFSLECADSLVEKLKKTKNK